MARGGARGQNTTRETKLSHYKLIGREDGKKKKKLLHFSSLFKWLVNSSFKRRIKLHFIIKQSLELARAKLAEAFYRHNSPSIF